MSLINTTIKPFSATAYQNGKFIPVSDETLKGKWSVIVFYPADFTFVCPTELEDLAENYDAFKKLGVEIYSVSTDSHFAHKAWHDTSPAIGKVKYPMIGDPTAALARNFDVLIEEEGMALRGTFGRPDKAVRNPRQRYRPRRIRTAAQGQGCPVRRRSPGGSLPRQMERRRRDADPLAGPGRQDLTFVLP